MEEQHQQPVLNIIGEKVALGPLRRDLIPLYHRWRNDFYVQRTFGDLPAPVTIEQRTAWFERQIAAENAYWFTIYEIPRSAAVNICAPGSEAAACGPRTGLRPVPTDDVHAEVVLPASMSAQDDGCSAQDNGLRPIGTTDLFNVDFRFRVGQFGMLIGEADARGKGYGSEVARLMLDYAFTALGLRNVMLTVAEYNLAGRRAYEKAGFKEFGRRRQSDIMNGRIYEMM